MMVSGNSGWTEHRFIPTPQSILRIQPARHLVTARWGKTIIILRMAPMPMLTLMISPSVRPDTSVRHTVSLPAPLHPRLPQLPPHTLELLTLFLCKAEDLGESQER